MTSCNSSESIFILDKSIANKLFSNLTPKFPILGLVISLVLKFSVTSTSNFFI